MTHSTQIAPYLYQGGISSLMDPIRFHVLVLCAMELQFDEEDGPQSSLLFKRVIRCPLDDAELTREEFDRALHTARVVAALVRQEQTVLITCAAGRNRSGLVMALTLHELTGKPGHHIVAHIQQKRPMALSNQSFVKALKAIPRRVVHTAAARGEKS